MKKLISLLLALVMVFSLATVAFADDEEPVISTKDDQDLTGYIDNSTYFTKLYTVNNGTAPAETFTFTVDNTNVTYKDNEGTVKTLSSYPTVTLGSAVFASAMPKPVDSVTTYTADATVTISGVTDTTPLGVYTYRIYENTPTTKTAGVDYVAEDVYLNLTVLRDEADGRHYVAAIHYLSTLTNDKTGSTENKYDAGTLSVEKIVTGNMGDVSKEFNFTVNFVAKNGYEIKSDIMLSVAGATPSSITDNTATFKLKSGDTAVFTNVPYDVTYTVTETPDTNYETSAQVNGSDVTLVNGATPAEEMNSATESVVFTNDRTSEVDTGITLDTLPFVLILAVCAGAVVLFVVKRRRSAEF